MENINKAITIQTYIRKWLSTSIYPRLSNNTHIKNKFEQEIKGYHLLNETPIKESVWEEINCNIVKDICKISDCAYGNHLSGKDNKFDNWNISNKTTKVENGKINMSSYRLSSVCNNKEPGNAIDIVREIEKRDSSFDYYSILLREETEQQLTYYWCLIPKHHHIFKLCSKTMKHRMGKIGKKKGDIVGWEDTYMDITFSMSSQLWYHCNMKDIKKYILYNTTVERIKPTISYSDIFEIVTSSN